MLLGLYLVSGVNITGKISMYPVVPLSATMVEADQRKLSHEVLVKLALDRWGKASKLSGVDCNVVLLPKLDHILEVRSHLIRIRHPCLLERQA